MRSLKGIYAKAHAIADAMPHNLGICRIHVAGDFFNQDYFRAWHLVAEWHPDRLFYAYTKSLSWWVEDRDHLPDNLVLTASRGGRLDHMIDLYNLRESKVVFSEAEADALGYEIDHTDEHAAIPAIRGESFALLIHGTQPKGSEASAAIKASKLVEPSSHTERRGHNVLYSSISLFFTCLRRVLRAMIILFLFILICLMFPSFGRGVWDGFWGND